MSALLRPESTQVHPVVALALQAQLAALAAKVAGLRADAAIAMDAGLLHEAAHIGRALADAERRYCDAADCMARHGIETDSMENSR
jgi:hypothetical protein